MANQKEMEEILIHTMERTVGNRYCGSSEEMDKLVELGFMKCIGQAPFCPDKYYTITELGKKQYKFLKGAK